MAATGAQTLEHPARDHVLRGRDHRRDLHERVVDPADVDEGLDQAGPCPPLEEGAPP
jgi:hypothetical protein